MIRKQLENAFDVFRRNHVPSPVFKQFEQHMRMPEKKVNVSFSHNGNMYNGFRIQYNTILGPAKGGIRAASYVNEDECTSLAFWMTIKTALFNLPLGGGKGGFNVDMSTMNEHDKEMICRKYVRAIYRDIGPTVDIPAPDVGTTSVMMDIMNDEYKKLSGCTSNGTFTGKTIPNGGSLGRTEATGYGVSYVASLYANQFIPNHDNNTYILQGFGNVGSHTALYMEKFLPSYKLVAVGDHTGYYHNPDGFNVQDLYNHNVTHKSLHGIAATIISKSDFFKIPVDIIIPAALECEIDETIAESINCKLMVEGANGPCTPEADLVLQRKGIQIIPDILANAGGVIVSYYEWVQNMNNEVYSHEHVIQLLKDKMYPVFCMIYIDHMQFDTRTKCYAESLNNIYHAYQLQYPAESENSL
jgi:glutamate dehydrogenase/leucine dehydrogenase